MKQYYFLVLVFLLFTSACKHEELNICDQTNDLKMNQVQIIASHNSYRIHTYQPLFDKLVALNAVFPQFDTKGFDYTHPPLEEQFGEYGVRGIELDIYYDPNGGLFYNRLANTLIPEPVESGIPELLEPGFKVLHVPDLDYMTHYYTFKQALQALKTWSDAHPTHLPIFVNVETKTEGLNDYVTVVGAIEPLPFTPQAANDLDQEVKAIFGDELQNVITPDKIRGSYATLNQAVKANNWLTLKQARGKVVFIINGNYDFYIDQHPSFAGRAMFAYANPDTPECAFIIANDAIDSQNDIEQWVADNYIVRTRTDSDTYEARNGDYSAMNAAFASGAQIISTDYYHPDPRHLTDTTWTDFTVQFANNELARINYISATPTTYPSCLLEE